MSASVGNMIKYEDVTGRKCEGSVWSAAPGGAYWLVTLEDGRRRFVKVRARPNSIIYREVIE